MAESYRRTGTQTVEPEYTGLVGKSFAVLVSADRVIQAESPGLTPRLCGAITDRLRASAQASGFVPAQVVLQFQYVTPGWEAMAPGEIAQRFQVDRLIIVDLNEHRLYETGNSYLWDGVASGRVSVIEADSSFPDEPAFAKDISVRFPDGKGFGPSDYNEQQVGSVLAARFVDRATWLFYEHQEPYYPDY